MKSKKEKAKSARTNSARKVVTPRNQWKKGLINCRWFQARPIENDSLLEKAFVQRGLLCTSVDLIESQPFTIKLAAGKYTPDFKLGIRATSAVIEVKIAKKVSKYVATFNEVAQRLSSSGVLFYVITEREIRAEHRDEHAAEILRYAKSQIPFADKARVIETLAVRGALSVAALREAAEVDTETIQHLVATRRLHCEPCLALDAESTVSIMPVPEDPLAHFEAYFNVKPWTHKPVPELARSTRSARLKKRPRRIGPILRAEHQDGERSAAIQLIAGGASAI